MFVLRKTRRSLVFALKKTRRIGPLLVSLVRRPWVGPPRRSGSGGQGWRPRTQARMLGAASWMGDGPNEYGKRGGGTRTWVQQPSASPTGGEQHFRAGG